MTMSYDYHRLIANALAAQIRANSVWGQQYWEGVVKQLTENMRKQDSVH